MRKVIFASVLLLLSSTASVGQDVAELAIIRTLLGVSSKTPVTSSSSLAAPRETPLKLYLDVSSDTPERDKKIKASMVQWMNKWGKGKNANGIAVEMVTDPAEARVSFIHYTDFPTEIVERDGNASGGGEIGPPSSSSTIKMSMMVYTYIVIMDSKKLIILYRRKDSSITRSSMVPGPYLTKAVTDRLRNEIDKEIEKRAMKSRSEKDSKGPDARLCEEFARWMASEDKSLKSQ